MTINPIPTHTAITPKPRFQGVKEELYLVDKALQKLPITQRIFGKALKITEGSSALSKVKFFPRYLYFMGAKMLVSRSWLERGEVSFVEFIESAFFYFCSPLAAKHVFSKLFQNLAASKLVKDKSHLKYLTTAVKDIPETALKTVLPIKAATILSGVLIAGVAGNYMLNFAKNLLTAGLFKKTEFKDIINLNQDKAKTTHNHEVSQKAWRRIAQTAVFASGVFAASYLLARYGAPSKFQKITQKLRSSL